jgi:SAM-dependent methyltransferase
MSLEMVSRNCPVCGSKDQSHVFAGENFDAAKWDGFAFASRKMPEYMHYRLIVCPTCDLLYASPLPTLEMLAEAYREADFGSAAEAGFAARTYGRLLPAIVRELPDCKGALDVGTGEGAFLKQLLNYGFTDVAGVEPSEAPIAAADDAIRPLIRKGLFSASEFPQERFRLITCFQTIEHLYDPLEMCRDAFSLLKDKGALLFVFHNRHAISARLLGRRSPIFDIEHLQLFSRQSARFLLEKAGFEDIQTKIVFNRYPLNYLLKLFPLPGLIKKTAMATAQSTRIGRLPFMLPAGNLAAIGFKK